MSKNITRVFQFDQLIRKENPQCIYAGKVDGKWKEISGKDFCDLTDNLAYGLINLGIKKGDKVSVISPNRTEWMVVDFALTKMTAINVPIYPNITAEQYKYILNDSEIQYVFIGNREIYENILAIADEVPSLKGIYTFDHIDEAKHWLEIVESGKANPKSSYIKDWQIETTKEDLFTIIYTSGTTGNPKGVMLSHDNIISQIKAVAYAFPLQKGDRSLSFLPLCHVFQRVAEYYVLSRIASTYYAESIETIGDNLREVKPQFMCTVPRLLEKVYDKIVLKGSELTGIKKTLFFWALNLGKQHELTGKSGWYNFQLKLANKIIFSKWREALGGNMQYLIVGAAALQPRLTRIFNAAQIPVYEGYGMSETSPVIAFNTPKEGEYCYGTVGKVIQHGQVKIAEDGEILYKGPNVMLGYYNLPDVTKDNFVDGWLKTGDIGEMVQNKYLKITDRKKEVFKTSGGKYVAPQSLENKMKESRFIEQIMVVGEGEKHVAALVLPFKDFLLEWCKRHGIEETSWNKILELEEVKSRIMDEVDELNLEFAQYMRIKKIVLIPDNWSVQSGELTPTQKLKRRNINSKYEETIKNIYK